ncbi:MAG: family 20 glycosylhydrolase [Bacteroidales bacterium]|nr:family 20 glycosylhydrolase [Bacteroidales bacterium]
MKRTITLLLLLIGIASAIYADNQSADPAVDMLMPKPHSVTVNGESFALNRDVNITDPTSSTMLASLFKTAQGAAATVTVKMVSATELGTFDYNLADFDNEGYKLSVTADAITITAVSKIGVIRAAQTLRQLAAATDDTYIAGVEITDWPAFKLRGFMHDVGRSFISFDELKKEIDLLSRFKVNVFHWHLTDNQGFRFESKAYPQLNASSAMTRFAGQYYTQAQCTQLEAYAAERGITVIPEIDMPGHSTAFTTAMGYTMNSTQGRAALKTLLGELAEAFPLAPYIHMGADEAGTTAEFVNEMSKYIKEELHRRCVVWNPISGVSISTSTLPYIDMTEMWSTSGRKISGVPNIDCRYNYVNHFDVFADLVGIYKSNIYYASQGSSELAGAITALWNDRKTPTETDIIAQNNLYANALATAERGWIGGGKEYIETGDITLPNSGEEFDEFADWERRFLYYKKLWLDAEPVPYVKQTNVKWRISDPFPNDGNADAIFPPEQLTDDILPATYTYKGKTYAVGSATGAGIYLRHTWGTTVPAYFDNPQLNTTAYAWTYVWSPTDQQAGALIEFQNYGRSENDRAPDAGKWDRKGSRIWLNDQEIIPPVWTNTGKTINSEVDLGNENFSARPPLSVQLKEGWNKVFVKLPYVSAGGVRLNKWMFTFVLTDEDGKEALDGLIYSPIKSTDPNVESVAELISSIRQYVNGQCGESPGYYSPAAAESLMAKVAEVEATMQTTLTAEQREQQCAALQADFDTFKSALATQQRSMPATSKGGDNHYYTLCTPLRGNRYATSTGVDGEMAGTSTPVAASYWKFVERADGTLDIVNATNGSYLSPASGNNTVLYTRSSSPEKGWTIKAADAIPYLIIMSELNNCEINQTNLGSSAFSGGYKIYNWGGGTNTTDTGCKYAIEEVSQDDIPLDLSDKALDELEGMMMQMAADAASTIYTDRWYVMFDRGANHGYLYENPSSHTLYNTATVPAGLAVSNARYLVRPVAAPDGKYYLQTGFGNYFGKIQKSVNVPVTAKAVEPLTIGKINNTAGHYYVQSAEGIVLDANDLSLGDSKATVVGWANSAPTTMGGNNDWAFYPVTFSDATNISFTANEVSVCQAHQTTGRGNHMQALLRLRLTPFADCTLNRINIALTGADQLDKVGVYATDIDQIHAAGADPQKLGESVPEEGSVAIDLDAAALAANEGKYLWITADIKADADEWAAVDAAIHSISYVGAAGDVSCDLTAKGNPDGVMRICKRQQFLWTASQSNAKYYRIPTIINTADGGIAAFADDRYDNTQDLGKVASGAAGNHKIDVVMRKSVDGGATWDEPRVIAAGDGTSAAACGYGDPAVVRTLGGKLICLMAAGNKSFPAGMLHMAYSESTDNGLTWSTPTDIYSAINKSGLTITSAFTSSGKGVTFSNGRVAFALNATVGGTTNEYILYSDNADTATPSWIIAPRMACASADESKLEIMNDNSLLLSVRQGGWNSMANRAYARTTGDASGTGIRNWGAKKQWPDLNANGCNADILYYSRITDGAGALDVMLHTIVKTFQTYRRDLRLYMSLDQGQSWREIIQLQPGYAAYSSMQRLPDGDLAIIFEDGSLGNQDKMDCYAINYVVLSRELINSFAESPDAISECAVTVTGNKSAEIYNLSGQRLNTPPDGGIYISNGRKVFAPQR